MKDSFLKNLKKAIKFIVLNNREAQKATLNIPTQKSKNNMLNSSFFIFKTHDLPLKSTKKS